MEHPLEIYNTLHRKKERFEPIHKPHVGLIRFITQSTPDIK